MPCARASRATLYVPILLATSPFRAIRSAPTTTTSTWPRPINDPAMLSAMRVKRGVAAYPLPPPPGPPRPPPDAPPRQAHKLGTHGTGRHERGPGLEIAPRHPRHLAPTCPALRRFGE